MVICHSPITVKCFLLGSVTNCLWTGRTFHHNYNQLLMLTWFSWLGETSIGLSGWRLVAVHLSVFGHSVCSFVVCFCEDF